MARDVVMRLAHGLEGMGHHITMENYFISIPLFIRLATLEIYATSTVRSNRVGLPLPLKNLSAFKQSPQGYLDWWMYMSRKVS